MNKCYVGVDIGSISTKGVVIDENNNILSSNYIWTEGNPIEAVKSNKQKITCLNKIKSTGESAQIYICDDGTCRFSEQECNSEFQCPLGYRSCGNKCILLSESCSLSNSCSSNEILCWDLSCAKNYASLILNAL